MSHEIVNNYGLSTNYVLINSSKCETVSSAQCNPALIYLWSTIYGKDLIPLQNLACNTNQTDPTKAFLSRPQLCEGFDLNFVIHDRTLSE